MFLVFGTNLQGVLLPILGHRRGSGMLAIGFFSSSWSIGFVLACLSVGQLLARLGHARSFVALALLSALGATCLMLFPSDGAWIGLRAATGFCYGGLSAIVEGWLVTLAGSGAGFACYLVVTLLASLCGTLGLGLVGASGRTPFLLAAIAVALSAAPVAFGRVPSPPVPPAVRPDLRQLLRRAPLGSLGCVAAGAITGIVGGLAPVFGMMSALDMMGDTEMLAANTLGGALASLPLALLARRIGRRRLLGCVTALGVLTCLPVALLGHTPPRALILLMGAFGMAQFPLYGLCVGLANEALTDWPPSRTSSELVLLFGLGTVAGPLVGAEILGAGTQVLFAFLALILMALGAGTLRLRPS